MGESEPETPTNIFPDSWPTETVDVCGPPWIRVGLICYMEVDN